MYEVSVQRTFRAAHAITMAGAVEDTHSHDWCVRVVVAGPRLDGDGLLCDFHAVQERLDEIVAPFVGGDLNAVEPFDRTNPTAEHLARHVADRIAPALPEGVALRRVSVTEAPGCVATYEKRVTE